MNHFTTPDFWQHYNDLPDNVRKLADKNYELLRNSPVHPSLRFRELHDGLWSVRVGMHYRALAFLEEDGYHWFWIGPHSEYDRLIIR
jgi:hypothetical protein